MTRRRDFLAQMGVAAAAIAFDADELRAATKADGHESPWDTSWLDRLAKAQYRVVFNGNVMNDGRGKISLVCNVALGNVGRGLAGQTHADVAVVQKELRENLVPGAILVPSGIYALIRAQNAGCAFMLGT